MNAAAGDFGRDAEVIVSWDRDAKGPGWARNRGLERATGDYVFFCNANATVRPDFLRRPIAELERTGADLCFFSYSGGPRLSAYVLDGNASVRAAYLPAFFGYSNEDVRRWNAGGSLTLLKEAGHVWRCAYRREFLVRNHIRFDECLTLSEGAAFLSNCIAFAARTVSIPDELYDCSPHPDDILGAGRPSRRQWDQKFLVKDFRARLDAATGGEIARYCEASHALTALEMLRLWRPAGLSFAEFRRDYARYLSDPRVRASLQSFPISPRHPVAALAVLFLRGFFR